VIHVQLVGGTYCGGVTVGSVPAFISWDGSSWEVVEFNIPSGGADASKCQGIAKSGDPAPTGKEVGDWYVFIGSGSLDWPGQVKDMPGIVILDRYEDVGGTNTAIWNGCLDGASLWDLTIFRKLP